MPRLLLAIADAQGTPLLGPQAQAPVVAQKTEVPSVLGGPTAQLTSEAPAGLPKDWSELCYAREEVVEQLLNLALRLQAYGRQGGPPAGDNVLAAVAQGLAALRQTSLAIIEALVAWQVRRAASRYRSLPRRHAIA